MSNKLTRRSAIQCSAAAAAALAIPAIPVLARPAKYDGIILPAEHTTVDLLTSYNAWLFYERYNLCGQMHPNDPNAWKFVPWNNAGSFWHLDGGEAFAAPNARSFEERAALTGRTCGWLES